MANQKLGKILYTEEQITKRAKEIAAQIDKDFEGEEVILLCTLKGSILWIGDIMKNLTIKTKLDFISASSYGASKTSSGVVKIKFDPEINMYNSNIIVVEDIVDVKISPESRCEVHSNEEHCVMVHSKVFYLVPFFQRHLFCVWCL